MYISLLLRYFAFNIESLVITSALFIQVLRHLEALEAAIELDMTMQSTAGLQSTPSAVLKNGQQVSPTSAAKRRLDLNSPPSTSPSEARRPFSLNLSGVSG
jgi:hypothetical protein